MFKRLTQKQNLLYRNDLKSIKDSGKMSLPLKNRCQKLVLTLKKFVFISNFLGNLV